MGVDRVELLPHWADLPVVELQAYFDDVYGFNPYQLGFTAPRGTVNLRPDNYIDFYIVYMRSVLVPKQTVVSTMSRT